MTWFKVDDTLHSHSKVDDATVASMGLWVLAGSWASNQLTDGFVPLSRARKIDPEHWQERAALLVMAGFWHDRPGCACVPDTSPLHEGRDGWQFHDWQDQQPSRQAVLDDRRKQAERVAAWREKRRAGRATPEGTSGSTATPDATEGVTAGATPAVRDGATNGVRTHAPSRPDPTAPKGAREGGVGGREGSGKEIDQEEIRRRALARVQGPPRDESVRNAAIAEMRSKLRPGTSLSRWPKENGNAEDR